MWEPSQSSDPDLSGNTMQWDQLIEGVRWYRQAPYAPNVFVYGFIIEDAEAVRALNTIDLDNFVLPDGYWQPANWWAESSNFPASDRFWRAELASRPAVHQAPTPTAETNSDDSDESESEDDTTQPVAQPGHGNVGQRLRDPIVISARKARYTKSGAYAWPVKMSVQDVQTQPSWIIQKVVVRDPKTRATFWEAFPVGANQAEATHQDTYQANHKLARGELTVTGLMQHHVFAGDKPPGMTTGGSEYCDRDQMATDTRPAFWGTGGTRHNLGYSWGPDGGEITTEPAAATLEVQHHTQVDPG